MQCEKCGYENEADAKFCRECGTKLVAIKGQVEFVPSKRVRRDTTGNIVIGVVFICVGLIIAIAILLPTLYSDFGTGIGDLAGGFGETMGNLGEDLGTFFGNFGDRFGNAVGNFFEGIFQEDFWLDLLQILIVAIFLITGTIIIIVNYRQR